MATLENAMVIPAAAPEGTSDHSTDLCHYCLNKLSEDQAFHCSEKCELLDDLDRRHVMRRVARQIRRFDPKSAEELDEAINRLVPAINLVKQHLEKVL